MTPLQQLEKRIRELVPCTYTVVANAGMSNEIHQALQIQLHHVLQAIDKTGLLISVDELGYFRQYDTNKFEWVLLTSTVQSWDLTLPLSGQSEETIKFLLEILK